MRPKVVRQATVSMGATLAPPTPGPGVIFPPMPTPGDVWDRMKDLLPKGDEGKTTQEKEAERIAANERKKGLAKFEAPQPMSQNNGTMQPGFINMANVSGMYEVVRNNIAFQKVQ